MPVIIFLLEKKGFNRASMNIFAFLKKNKHRWWVLPLILPVVLLPVLSVANTFTHLGDGIAALYYLPLSFLLSLMMFFGLGSPSRDRVVAVYPLLPVGRDV